MHCVWLCSPRLLRGGGRVGAHTLYAYWGFVHTLAVSWDIPPSGIVIGVTSLLEVCLMRSQPCADLLYEAPKTQRHKGYRITAEHWTVCRILSCVWSVYLNLLYI